MDETSKKSLYDLIVNSRDLKKMLPTIARAVAKFDTIQKLTKIAANSNASDLMLIETITFSSKLLFTINPQTDGFQVHCKIDKKDDLISFEDLKHFQASFLTRSQREKENTKLKAKSDDLTFIVSSIEQIIAKLNIIKEKGAVLEYTQVFPVDIKLVKLFG